MDKLCALDWYVDKALEGQNCLIMLLEFIKNTHHISFVDDYKQILDLLEAFIYKGKMLYSGSIKTNI